MPSSAQELPLDQPELPLIREDPVDAALLASESGGSSSTSNDQAMPPQSICAPGLKCLRCDRLGHVDAQCPHFSLAPLRHADATSRGVGPHMRETDTNAILASTFQGQASGRRNNCLIDSLRQLLQPAAQVAPIRRALQLEYRDGARKVTSSNFLQFDFHAVSVIRLLGFDPRLFTLTCVDLVHRGHGDVIGRGARRLYLARQGQNHFIPLFPRASQR